MPDSTNSNHSELSKEDKDTAYKANFSLEHAETDLKNCRNAMELGKFFKAMDFLNEGIGYLTIAQKEYQEFVKELRLKKIW